MWDSPVQFFRIDFVNGSHLQIETHAGHTASKLAFLVWNPPERRAACFGSRWLIIIHLGFVSAPKGGLTVYEPSVEQDCLRPHLR